MLLPLLPVITYEGLEQALGFVERTARDHALGQVLEHRGVARLGLQRIDVSKVAMRSVFSRRRATPRSSRATGRCASSIRSPSGSKSRTTIWLM